MCVMRMRRARLCPHTLTHTGRPPCCSADRQRACTPAPPDPAGRSRARRRPPPATAPPPTRPTAPQAARAPPSPLPPAARGCRLLASPPPFAAARSGPVRHRRSRPIQGRSIPLSGRCRLRCSRPAQPGMCSARVVPLPVVRAHRCCRRAARLQPNGQHGRPERWKIEGAGSRHRCALGPPGCIAAGAPMPPLSGALGSGLRRATSEADSLAREAARVNS